MRCLAIDCATSACSVALFEGLYIPNNISPDLDKAGSDHGGLNASATVGETQNWTLLADDYRDLGRGHAEQLIPMVEALPDNGRANQIAVALGPGSFTGLRIGIAAARALAIAWDAEVVGYPSMALIAAQALAANKDKNSSLPVTIAMLGGHGQWFVQSYHSDGSADSELYSLTPSEAVKKFSNRLVAGSAAPEFGRIRKVKHAIAMLPDSKSLPLLKIQYFTWVISPIYGREPDARISGNG